MELGLMRIGASLFLCVQLVACSDGNDATTTAPGAGGSQSVPSGSTATAQQIDDCKQGCDKMKFFDCSTADEMAACYDECQKAAASQIEVFVACAQNSICDPQCRLSIKPKEAQAQPHPTPSNASCNSACDKGIQCGFVPAEAKAQCLSECSQAYQFEIDCVNNNPCDRIAKACGYEGSVNVGSGGSGQDTSFIDISRCQSACDTLNFDECLTADEHSACRTKCQNPGNADRSTFAACVDTSHSSDCEKPKACFNTFSK